MSVKNIGLTATKKDLKKIILITGFIAGTLDIAAAFLTNLHINPLRILRYIASGALGASAFSGVIFTAILGLLFHFIIAYTWTTFFFLLFPYINRYSKNVILNAVLYGIIIWLVMNLIVLPLSNVPEPNPDFYDIIKGIIILILMVGFPISFLSNRYYQTRKE